MTATWQETPVAFTFQAGTLTGRLMKDEPAAPWLQLQCPNGLTLELTTPGPIQYRAGTRSAHTALPIMSSAAPTAAETSAALVSLPPVPLPPYRQFPYVIAPFQLTSAEGLDLCSYCRVTADGFDWDLRLLTREPIHDLVVTAQVRWLGELAQFWQRQQTTIQPIKPDTSVHSQMAGKSLDKNELTGELESAGVAQCADSGFSLLIDVGETGNAIWTATPLPAAEPDTEVKTVASTSVPVDLWEQRLQLSFFRQELERGVILVGRLGFRHHSEPVATEVLQTMLHQFLTQPSSL